MKRLLIAGVAALAVAAPAAAITGGSLDGTGHPAVGLVLADRGNGPEPDCSGVLVSSTVLVTAAHCAGSLVTDRVEVTFDSQYTTGSTLLEGTLYPDPAYDPAAKDTHDVAVVVLDAPAGVSPLPLAGQGLLDGNLRGREFVNVGYGYSDRTFSFDGARRVSTSTFTMTTPTELKLSNNHGGVCFGDSGGPRLLDGVVAAITSSGNPTCTGQAWSYRLDTPSARSFLAQYVTLS